MCFCWDACPGCRVRGTRGHTEAGDNARRGLFSSRRIVSHEKNDFFFQFPFLRKLP